MHSKAKGSVGEAAITTELLQNDCRVFKEFGDLSRVDLIAELPSKKLIRIQCKAYTPKRGVISLAFKKNGPNYEFKYSPDDFDYIAMYNLDSGKTAWVSSKLIESSQNITLRLDDTKNNQAKGVQWFDDYSIQRMLRDYTGDTLRGDDIVQTATMKVG